MYEGSIEMSADVRDWRGSSHVICFSVLSKTIQSTNTTYTKPFNASSNKSYINKPINYRHLQFMIRKTHFLYEQWSGATLKLRGSTAPFIANLCTMWRRVVSFSPRPVYSHWKTPRTHWGRNLVGRQPRSGHAIEENNILLLRGI